MFELEFMKVYSGTEIANAIKYNQGEDIERYLGSKYEFRQRVDKPQRPGKWASRNTWANYNYNLEKYNCYQASLSDAYKFVLDSQRSYVITSNGHKIWLNYRTKKEISIYSPELQLSLSKYIGYYIPEISALLISHQWKFYTVNFETKEIKPWTGGY